MKIAFVSFFLMILNGSCIFGQELIVYLPSQKNWRTLSEITYEVGDSLYYYSDFDIVVLDSVNKRFYWLSTDLNYLIDDKLTLGVEGFAIYRAKLSGISLNKTSTIALNLKSCMKLFCAKRKKINILSQGMISEFFVDNKKFVRVSNDEIENYLYLKELLIK